ncbi:MAG: hypothetical protein AAFN10_07755 [Bacteroidota bacterium]
MENRFSHKRSAWRVALWLVLWSMPMLTIGSTVEESIVIKKTLRLNSDQTLSISNRYGDVNINSWNEDYTKVVVTIYAHSADPERARERLDEVEILERKTSSGVVLETEILSKTFTLLRQQGIEVSYDISIPKNIPLDIENRFGDVYLDARSGNVKIDIKNGNIVAKDLTGEDNRIKLQFGQADLSKVNGGNLDIAFGQLFLTEGQDIFLKGNGAVVRIDQVKEIELSANLGEIKIDEVDIITGSYTSTKVTVGRLNQKAELDIKAAIGFEIEEVAPGFEGIVLTGNFTALNLGFHEEATFKVDAQVEKGELTGHNLGVDIQSTTQEEKMTIYQTQTLVPPASGSISRTGKPGLVKIHSKYGNVRISKG